MDCSLEQREQIIISVIRILSKVAEKINQFSVKSSKKNPQQIPFCSKNPHIFEKSLNAPKILFEIRLFVARPTIHTLVFSFR